MISARIKSLSNCEYWKFENTLGGTHRAPFSTDFPLDFLIGIVTSFFAPPIVILESP